MSVSSAPPETAAEVPFTPLSHDQSHDPSASLRQLGNQSESLKRQRMQKQLSYDLMEGAHPTAAIPEGRRMHRSSSSNTTTSVVRPLEGQSLGSSFHGDLLPSSIIGQRAWKFNSNPSSGNVSQENILASSHSDVSPPVLVQRASSRTHHPQPYHQRAFSNSHTFSQDHQVVPYHLHSSSGSFHAVNQQVSPSFPVGDFNEVLPYVNNACLPSQHAQNGPTLSQASSCHCCAVQPCACQQYTASAFQSQDQIAPAGFHGHHHHHHHSTGSGGYACVSCGAGSRSTSQASMRPQLQPVAQPPQNFPTAYPSMQNITQQTFLPSSSFTSPHQTMRLPPTRHLPLINPHEHHQQTHPYSGYGTDGSGDDVFHSYSGEHQPAVPERSRTHPQASGSMNGTPRSTRSHIRAPPDPVSNQTESTGSRRTPVHSGARGSEVSMEMQYVGPAIAEKNASKRVWDAPSHSGELNDSDSGFRESSPHGVSGESGRRSFTPNTSARLTSELRKLQQPPPSPIRSNSSSKSTRAESPNKQFTRQSKKKPSSISREHDNDREDSLSDDNIPVVYKDDENDTKWTSLVRPNKERSRTITRGAVQYRSLRYERDKQIHRRKPNRNSFQSFDGNTVDSCRQKQVAPKSPGVANGSSHRLKSKSSQDNLANLLTGLPPEVRNGLMQLSRQYPQQESGKLM